MFREEWTNHTLIRGPNGNHKALGSLGFLLKCSIILSHYRLYFLDGDIIDQELFQKMQILFPAPLEV